MTNIKIDLSKTSGKIKPMNAVNNGPTNPGVRKVKTDFDAYKEAHFPYARNHDASFYSPYGGEHLVDVHRIFKNFSADENDPSSYIFEPTDKYLKNTIDAGTKIFYRLGASIEHYYKYGTKVPPDFTKWARICEHIIRHYTEGWADGFEWNIEYWEIWNEPDCLNADGSNPCWQGTEEEFIDFYEIAAKHLKSCFPNLKIGGPAFCSFSEPDTFRNKFINAILERQIPLDFFSYHWYGRDLAIGTETGKKIAIETAFRRAREFLDSHGLTNTETILNEWNYVRGWSGDEWDYSIRCEKNLKGSSFVLGAMMVGQASPLDMLMYYDARPCAMNGLFDQLTFEPLKPYYAFRIFDEIAQLGTQIPSVYFNEDIYTLASTNGKSYAAALTYYEDKDEDVKKDVKLTFTSLSGKKKVLVYILDTEHDLTLTREEIFTADEFSVYLTVPKFTSALIKIESSE